MIGHPPQTKCEGQPCRLEHRYLCQTCHALFFTDENTHFTDPDTRQVRPSEGYPLCPNCHGEDWQHSRFDHEYTGEPKDDEI